MGKRLTYGALLVGTLGCFSCSNMPSQTHGPIVLGDSSSIVTERDPARLQDLVADLKPTITSSEPKDTEATPKDNTPQKGPDTAKKTTTTANTTTTAAATKPAPPAALTGAGLKADFGVVSMLIPGLTAKQSGNPNLEHANGAVFTYQSGTLNGNVIKVNVNVIKISQRYQSVVILKNELGVLPLESLSLTSDWIPLKGINGMYRISGLDEKSLEYPDAERNQIRNAVSKAAQRRRYSRRKIQDWVNSVRNVRNINQKPLYVTVRSVMWKIDGKDANGKLFSKQIRIDIPL